MQICENYYTKIRNLKWKQRIGEFQILICVAFFGLSFTIQRMAAVNPDKLTQIGPITYNAMRYLISTIILAFVLPILKRIEDKEASKEKDSDEEMDDIEVGEDKSTKEPMDGHTSWYYAWYYGSICGFTGFIGSSLQQIGLMHTSIAKTAFITALFVIVVPLIESLLPGGRMSHSTWTAACMSMLGTFYISGLAEASERGTMSETGGMSELTIFISMLFWTIAIMATDRGCKKCDGVLLTAIDFLCVTICSIIAGMIFEPDEWKYPFTHIRSNMYLIIGVGITETVGFVFCALGQMTVSSSRAALLLSLESLSGAICGYIFLHETLTTVEMLGCILMVISFLISVEEWNYTDMMKIYMKWRCSDSNCNLGIATTHSVSNASNNDGSNGNGAEGTQGSIQITPMNKHLYDM